jgi:hypothetical protein
MIPNSNIWFRSDGPLKDILFPKVPNTPVRMAKDTAKHLITEARRLLKGDSSCLVVFADSAQLGTLAEHMESLLYLHHSVVYGHLVRGLTAEGTEDNRLCPYFEVCDA